MTFMYLHLRSDKEGKVHARIQPSGEMKFSSLGGPNSQQTNMPFAVMRIEAFDGLEHIADGELLAELLRRQSATATLRSLAASMSNDDLLRMIEQRLKPLKSQAGSS